MAGYRAAHDHSGIQRRPFAVAVGQAKGRKAGQTNYVLCHQPKSFDWRLRGAKAHLLRALSDGPFAQVCERLNQIIHLS